MIVFDLQCEHGHTFEAWFKDSDAFELQKEQGLLECPVCSSHNVRKILSPVGIRKNNNACSSDGPASDEAVAAVLQGIYRNIIKNSEDVGARFATEALKMHYGLAEQRSIRGVASAEEEKMLKDEGIEFFRIPVPVKKKEGEKW